MDSTLIHHYTIEFLIFILNWWVWKIVLTRFRVFSMSAQIRLVTLLLISSSTGWLLKLHNALLTPLCSLGKNGCRDVATLSREDESSSKCIRLILIHCSTSGHKSQRSLWCMINLDRYNSLMDVQDWLPFLKRIVALWDCTMYLSSSENIGFLLTMMICLIQ